jgi:methylmalonyl-CoA mutase
MNQQELDISKDFAAITDEQWRDLVIKDLKGKDFSDTLEWKANEQLTFQPYYRNSDFQKIKNPERFRVLPSEWVIQQNYSGSSATNAKIMDALEKGAEGIGIELSTQSDLNALMKGVYIDAISLHLTGAISKETFNQLDKLVADKNIEKSSIQGMLDFSPLSTAVKKGENQSLDELVDLIQTNGANYPNLKMIHIDARIVKNAGGNEIQEIAFALAQANEYINQLIEKGIEAFAVINTMAFSFSYGTSYFMEIAKTRAFRFLFQSLCQQYSVAAEPVIYAETASIVYSKKDPYTNLLRATTAAMSAVIGGCNNLVVLPHNIGLENSSDFADRIARNIQIVVKEEAHFAKVKDAGAGSYYIEQICDELAKEAWSFFQEIEIIGGYAAAIQSELIQNTVEGSRKSTEEALKNETEIRIGINKFQSADKIDFKELPTEEIVGKEFKAMNPIRWATPFEK